MSVAIPLTLHEALDALRITPDARLIQGGTDMMVEINFNHLKPNNVIALRRVQELRTWRKNTNNTVTIGTGVPYQEMETGELKQLLPALAEAARTVGSPQIRAAGTLGGNLGTCSPAGDGLPVLFALDAIVHLQSSDSSRDLSIQTKSSLPLPSHYSTVGRDMQKLVYATQWSSQLHRLAWRLIRHLNLYALLSVPLVQQLFDAKMPSLG
jgi:CO/xanthine dehydrogenase FAD-binding subunit